MKNLFRHILEAHKDGLPMVQATVIKTSGSTPQKPGSSVLFGIDGIIAGTIGGGILEGRVHQIAANSISTKKSGLQQFELDKDITQKGEAICGGMATVLIDSDPGSNSAVYEQIRKSLSNKIPGVLVTVANISGEKELTIHRHWCTESDKNPLSDQLASPVEKEIKKLIVSGDTEGFFQLETRNSEGEYSKIIFLEPIFPDPHLVIAGAGHIGKSLAHLGRMLDYEVTVIDDRPEFANKSNIPDADNIIVRDIGTALEKIKKDSNTFIVIVTRGHSDDASALKSCIDSGAAYIGMIGSRTKIEAIHGNFISNGLATPEQWNRIFAPVGLNIKSKTVAEIAISIAAQIISIRNSKKYSDG